MATLSVRSQDVNLQASRQPEMLKEMIPFVSLACITVILRLSARKYFTIALGADDYMIVVGLVR